jgi:hypothetical protein
MPAKAGLYRRFKRPVTSGVRVEDVPKRLDDLRRVDTNGLECRGNVAGHFVRQRRIARAQAVVQEYASGECRLFAGRPDGRRPRELEEVDEPPLSL